MRRRTAGSLVAGLLALSGCSDAGDGNQDGQDGQDASTTSAAPASTAPSPSTTEGAAGDLLAGFEPAAPEWAACGAGVECATLAVPLDWDDPAGPTIDLALARVPAGDPARRIGTLVTNPGGPGASGVEFVSQSPFDGVLAERFDQVSWDPRGVGGSAPLACAEDEIDAFVRLDSDPDTPAEQAALDGAAAAIGAECGAEFGELLPNVGTDEAAKDLEAIRRAMGEPMSYVGFSYGTFIGLRYAELFPGGARAIVLDGVVDPTHGLPDLLRGQTVAFERVLTEALGPELATYDRVAARAEAAPIPTADGRGLGPADLATGTVLAGYDDGFWPLLRRGVQEADAGDGTRLLRFADEYRRLGSYTAYQAVSCIDSEHPEGPEAWADFAAELEGISARWGAAIANEMLPCATWPASAEPVNEPVAAEGSAPILVIGTTGDPATPVEQAERVAAGLASGHLLVFDGEGHTAYGQSPCVDAAVERYLVDGILPTTGTRC